MKIFVAFILFSFLNCQNLYSQNRGRFRHIIRAASVASGYLPLVYNDGAINHILYGPTPSVLHTYCGDLEAIVSISGNNINVDFLTITTPPTPGSTCISAATHLGTFRLDLARLTLGDPTFAVKIPFKFRTIAVATVPFRYRFATDSSFSTVSTNLGASLSYNWSLWGRSIVTHRAITNYCVLLGPFIGVTSVDLKKATVKNPTSWKNDLTNFGFSYGVNVTFARNNFGIVISIGADHAFGLNSTKWSYQDKPWIGLGVNTSLGIF